MSSNARENRATRRFISTDRLKMLGNIAYQVLRNGVGHCGDWLGFNRIEGGGKAMRQPTWKTTDPIVQLLPNRYNEKNQGHLSMGIKYSSWRHSHSITTRGALVSTISVYLLFGASPACSQESDQKPESEHSKPTLTELDSEDGRAFLQESRYSSDYWALTRHYSPQKNLAYCGIATTVTVLNALPGSKQPAEATYGTYPYYTQDNIFTNRVRSIVKPEVVEKNGLTLDELGSVLREFPIDAAVHHASESTLEEFRSQAMEVLFQPNDFLIVNYNRATLGQKGAGHISPVAAYHQKTDRFLILDVAPYKYPPVWVDAKDLWQAMMSIDSTSGKSRGYIVVTPRSSANQEISERQPDPKPSQ